MNREYEKNIRIITDVMGYCHYLGALELQAGLSLLPGGSRLTITAKAPGLSAQQVTEIDTYLNIPRQREVEQNYWNICGEEEMDAELSLAGMMVDSAAVRYENGLLTIQMERLDQR